MAPSRRITAVSAVVGLGCALGRGLGVAAPPPLRRVVVAGPRFSSPPRETDDGERRFFEADGAERELLFRGVNVVYKDPPWIPHTAGFQSNLSFVEDDVLLLKGLGVNLVRLGVMWPGLVPQRGRICHTYVSAIRHIIDMCAKHGIYTLVEPHQDEMNPIFCGEGAPDWWVKEQHLSTATFPLPLQEKPFATSPPSWEMCQQHISFDYIWTKDAAAAYQHLYETSAKSDGTSGFGPFGEYWASMAKIFAGVPGVLGGELWNEPFPGDVFTHSKYRQNDYADAHNLQPWYTNLTAAIRAESKDMLVAYEPSWPVGTQDIQPDSLLPPTSGFEVREGEPNIFEDQIYAFHWYTPPCTTDLQAYLTGRAEDARRLHAAPLATEYNFEAYSEATEVRMRDQIRTFEQVFRISYSGWQYKSYAGSLPRGTCTGCGNSFFKADGSLREHMAAALGGQPFAQAVAGEVESIQSGDRGSGTFVGSEHFAAVLDQHIARDKWYMLKARASLGYLRKHREQAITELVAPGWWSGGDQERAVVRVATVEGADDEGTKRIMDTLVYKADSEDMGARVVRAIGGAPNVRIPAYRRWRVYPTCESLNKLSGISADTIVVFEVTLEVVTERGAASLRGSRDSDPPVQFQ